MMMDGIEPPLAHDLLEGAREIARFIYGDPDSERKIRRAIHARGLPVFRLGGRICARRSVIMAWIRAQEMPGSTGFYR